MTLSARDLSKLAKASQSVVRFRAYSVLETTEVAPMYRLERGDVSNRSRVAAARWLPEKELERQINKLRRFGHAVIGDSPISVFLKNLGISDQDGRLAEIITRELLKLCLIKIHRNPIGSSDGMERFRLASLDSCNLRELLPKVAIEIMNWEKTPSCIPLTRAGNYAQAVKHCHFLLSRLAESQGSDTIPHFTHIKPLLILYKGMLFEVNIPVAVLNGLVARGEVSLEALFEDNDFVRAVADDPEAFLLLPNFL